MAKIDVFPQCRMQSFARLVTRELGVRVRLRGREVCVEYSRPPVIYLPNLENARDADVLPLFGFCLHEAAHLKYTDRKISASAPNYLVKIVHNAIEDVYIETRLEKDFPGAREMLVRSYVDGIKAMFGAKPVVDPKSLLSPERRGEIVAEMKKIGMDADDENLVGDVTNRLEILRAAKLWIIASRRYPLPLFDWPTHPWRAVFDQETTPKARNTREAYDQAVRIIERLGIKPCLPGDERPIKVATDKRADADAKREAARDAGRALRAAKRESNSEIKRRREELPEHQRLAEARDAIRDAEENLAEANAAVEDASRRVKEANESVERARRLLEEARARLERLRQETDSSQPVKREELQGKAERLADRVRRLEEALARREARATEIEARSQDAESKAAGAQRALDAAREAEREAAKAYATESERVRREVIEWRKPVLERLAEDAKLKGEAAASAKETADKAMAEIGKRDKPHDEHVAPGAAKAVAEAAFESHREQDAEQEDETAAGRAGEIVRRALRGAPTRKYTPYDRSLDRVDRVVETPQARLEYERARSEMARVIAETTERLRRLRPPTGSALKVNAERGRLDPRKAYRIGLAQRGCAVDLSRAWRETTPRADSKVAVSLLLDCSGSMSSGSGAEPPIDVARRTATALSEVLRALSIPHEIVGHTTLSDEAEQMIKRGEVAAGEIHHFSRLTPFHGYVFKEFAGKSAPASLFGEVGMQENLDGEALLWAVQRLATRPEKAKLCISISDGMPAASFANCAELERHLLLTCKQIEAQEGEGLFLFGIGIGEPRVGKFYKNAETITEVGDLPRVVLGIVERVMGAAR